MLHPLDANTRQKDIRDPRFDPLCGHYNPSLFDRSYGFLKDYQVSEVETLKGEAKKTKSAEEKEKLEKAVESMVCLVLS